METTEERIAKLTPEQRELLNLRIKKMNKRKKSEILLTLQEGDSAKRRPVFCLHPPLGVTGYYINISRRLHAEQPVYGLQSPAFYNIREPFDNMEEMAAYYLEAIRTIQPEPPYSFLAHSSGAFIAYEMASQLKNHEQNVPVLIFIDQPAPIGEQEEVMEAFKDPNLEESDEAMFLTVWLVSLVYNQPIPFTIDNIKSCAGIEEKYQLVATFLKQAGFIPANADNEMVRVILKMIANHTIADTKYYEKYTPAGAEQKYTGHTVLLRCTEETKWSGFDVTSPVDTSDYSNWEKFCSGPIDVIGIPAANHISIIMEPCVQSIAEHVRKYLDQVTPI